MKSLSIWILDYLDSHLYEEISIDILSDYIGYDKYYIMKIFKNDVGISIKTYINQQKIINSLKLLEEDSYLLSIALNSGYNSLEYYSEVFSKIMGVSPSIYRKYLLGICKEEERIIIESSLLLLGELKSKIDKIRYKKDINVLAYNNKNKKCA